jgi:lysophospholipase L1-like esterase
MKKIVCFGDSITEMGTALALRGYVIQLVDRYTRRADVIARGFSGYTSREARKLLEPAVLRLEPDFVILFFGANDSVLPDQVPHVPPAEYAQNLRDIADRVAYTGAWLILVTPPPVNERLTKSRRLEHTEHYAKACREIGREMNVPVIDLFHDLQQEYDWANTCLLDGIHLSALGMDFLYERFVLEIDRIWPFDTFERIGVEGY